MNTEDVLAALQKSSLELNGLRYELDEANKALGDGDSLTGQ